MNTETISKFADILAAAQNKAGLGLKSDSTTDCIKILVSDCADKTDTSAKPEEIYNHSIAPSQSVATVSNLEISDKRKLAKVKPIEFSGLGFINFEIVKSELWPVNKNKMPVQKPDSVPEYQISKYSERSIVLRGETKKIKDKLMDLGGVFNFRLTGGMGWIFPKTRENDLRMALGL